jgi:hypothetical protein
VTFRQGQGLNVDLRAVTAQLERGEALDRVQAGKRRLRDTLDRLESEACRLDTLATAARQSLLRATSRLRKELASPLPCTDAVYEAQRDAIAIASAATEHELIALGPIMSGSGVGHFKTAIGRMVGAMLRLDAAFDEAE